jgi:beta-glucosidase
MSDVHVINAVAASSTDESIEALLSQMTLAEKIGQMAQVEKNSISPEETADYLLGSVLSGGGGNPTPNSPHHWAEMAHAYAEAALQTRLQIPLMYGVDAVHGHNNCYGAVVYPHNIGLGATRDADLVERIGRATAVEVLATNVHWNFAPCLAVTQDYRWGRTYESYGSNTGLVSELGAAYVRGLQAGGVAACIKHYVGDGAAEWNTHRTVSWATFWESNGGMWTIDQGDVNLDEPTFRAVHLAPYLASLEAGALTVMASFSSWRGLKMHAHRYLLTDVLKNELGFRGFVVSDWMGLNQISPDMYTCVVHCINAGVDMVMVPYDYKGFISTLTQAVENGDVPLSRIDDAVRRILYVKQQLGLFEKPLVDEALMAEFGAQTRRELAREAVRKSLVLLKHERAALPLSGQASLLIAGDGADDMGLQCGGWTVEWQGARGSIVPGTTLVQALRSRLGAEALRFDAEANFPAGTHADVGVLVVAEEPYAEGCGDRADLSLTEADHARIERLRPLVDKLVLVIYSGRPLIITPIIDQCDAVVAAWLPGSAGEGLADVLCGDHPFTGRLPVEWIASMDQLPISRLAERGEQPLFAYGFGL